jgi:hypothetical protein
MKKKQIRRRLPLAEEIAEVETHDPRKNRSLTISMLEEVYLKILIAMRDGPYINPSAYLNDLIRRDWQRKIPATDAHGHEADAPADGHPKLGFQRDGRPFLGAFAAILLAASTIGHTALS